uniref:Uncharacterized protein n=1 Tax=Oryza punctata TaxID=4537 RepID=A0A0E0LL00_ORYPU
MALSLADMGLESVTTGAVELIGSATTAVLEVPAYGEEECALRLKSTALIPPLPASIPLATHAQAVTVRDAVWVGWEADNTTTRVKNYNMEAEELQVDLGDNARVEVRKREVRWRDIAGERWPRKVAAGLGGEGERECKKEMWKKMYHSNARGVRPLASLHGPVGYHVMSRVVSAIGKDYSFWLPHGGGNQRIPCFGDAPAGLPYCCGTPHGWLALADAPHSLTRLILWEPVS